MNFEYCAMARSHRLQHPTWYPHDHLLHATLLRLIPQAVQPNHITIARLLLTPLVLWLLWNSWYELALPLFAVTAFTDVLDGSLARTRNLITPWGILFDPLADKLLVGSVALMLAAQYFHPGIIFFAIFLDILPSLRFAFRGSEGELMMANVWGKTKMVLQCTSLIVLMLGIVFSVPFLVMWSEYILGTALIFSLIAVITYSL